MIRKLNGIDEIYFYAKSLKRKNSALVTNVPAHVKVSKRIYVKSGYKFYPNTVCD